MDHVGSMCLLRNVLRGALELPLNNVFIKMVKDDGRIKSNELEHDLVKVCIKFS